MKQNLQKSDREDGEEEKFVNCKAENLKVQTLQYRKGRLPSSQAQQQA